MDQIALRVTLTLLKNLSEKQIRLPSNMVARTKEQPIMSIDPYVRVTEVKTGSVKTSFINTNFVHNLCGGTVGKCSIPVYRIDEPD